MNQLIVFLCIIGAAFLWRFLFWRVITREGANKSWTLLSSGDVKSFRNFGTFSVIMIWSFTYLVFWGDSLLLHHDPWILFAGMKTFMLLASLFYPTIGANLDLKYQIKQEMQAD